MLNKTLSESRETAAISEKNIEWFFSAPLKFEKEVISNNSEKFKADFINAAANQLLKKLSCDEYFYCEIEDDNYKRIFNNIYFSVIDKNFKIKVHELILKNKPKNSLLKSPMYLEIISNVAEHVKKNPIEFLKIKTSIYSSRLIL